jgi:hypothetical protein
LPGRERVKLTCRMAGVPDPGRNRIKTLIFKREQGNTKSMETLSACIKEISILEETISFKCVLRENSPPEAVEFLRHARTKKNRFSVKITSHRDPSLVLFWDCYVRSINLQQNVHFVLHFSKNYHKAQEAIKFMKDKNVNITFIKELTKSLDKEKNKHNSTLDNKLSYFLNSLSQITSKSSSQLLKEVTEFHGKDGTLVPGKDSIESLSERQKEVVVDKLRRLKKKITTLNAPERAIQM